MSWSPGILSGYPQVVKRFCPRNREKVFYFGHKGLQVDFFGVNHPVKVVLFNDETAAKFLHWVYLIFVMMEMLIFIISSALAS